MKGPFFLLCVCERGAASKGFEGYPPKKSVSFLLWVRVELIQSPVGWNFVHRGGILLGFIFRIVSVDRKIIHFLFSY